MSNTLSLTDAQIWRVMKAIVAANGGKMSALTRKALRASLKKEYPDEPAGSHVRLQEAIRSFRENEKDEVQPGGGPSDQNADHPVRIPSYLASSIDQLRESCERAMREMRAASDEGARALIESAEARAEDAIRQVKTELNAAQKDLEEMCVELDEAEAQRNAMRQVRDEYASRIEVLERELREAQRSASNTAEEYRRDLRIAHEAKAAADADCHAAREDVAKLQATLDAEADRRLDAEAKIREYEERAARANELAARREWELENANREIASLRISSPESKRGRAAADGAPGAERPPASHTRASGAATKNRDNKPKAGAT